MEFLSQSQAGQDAFAHSLIGNSGTFLDILQGDATKARLVLGWEPKTDFNELVKIMVDAEEV